MEVPREASLFLEGHEEALATFRHAFQAGRLHHAWLLAGPEGVGKAALAFMMARIVLGGEAQDSPAGRRISAATHADLLSIARSFDEKRGRLRGEIVADEIRPVSAFMRRTAAEGGWRVVVIDGADHMNRNAANALLKILEEPPPEALLILTCTSPGRLLPTIRSRCRQLSLHALTDSEMRRVLAREAPEAALADLDRVIAEAGGSPGRAMTMLADGFAEMRVLAMEAIDGVSVKRAVEIADRFARDDQASMAFLTQMTDLVADRARAYALRKDPQAGRYAQLWETLSRLASETARFSLDRQETLIEAMTVASSP
ncbi:MAG: DNA polymerase III subunit delta' [Acetobacter sp.]|nr:DNA polymerase III subunit delta' [Acetobacter sp.]